MRRVVESDNSITAFITLLFETIQQVKNQRQKIDFLTWSQLQDICADISRKRAASIRSKYQTELYLEREGVYQEFCRFLASDKSCFVLLGKSGVGKSNFLLAIGDKLRASRSDICVLIYDGGKLNTRIGVEGVIANDFDNRLDLSDRRIQNPWREIARIDDIKQRLFLLIVDAVNENVHSTELLRQLDELVQSCWPWLKIVFSSRPETWQTIRRGLKQHLAEDLYYRSAQSDGLGVHLEPFSYARKSDLLLHQELPAAYKNYQDFFDLRTDYEALPHYLREMLRDPLNLWLVSNTYRNSAIPATLKASELISHYVQALRNTRRLHDDDVRLLEKQLMPLMIQPGSYTNAVSLAAIDAAGGGLYDLIFSEQILRDGQRANQSFTNLVDADILIQQDHGIEQQIAFKFERFYEYFAGRRIAELLQTQSDHDAFFTDIVKQITQAPYLWGAVKHVLIQDTRDHGPEFVRRFCFTDQQRVKELIISTLIDLGQDEPDIVEAMLRSILPPPVRMSGIQKLTQFIRRPAVSLDLRRRNAAQIAVEVASGVQRPSVLCAAALQADSTVRAVAVRYIYYLWQSNRSAGFMVLRQLVAEATRGTIPNLIAFESVLGLSLIIFFDNYREDLVVRELQMIWQEIIAKYFGIRDRDGRGTGPVRTFVRNRIFSLLVGLIFQLFREFPQNNIVNYDDLNAFFQLDSGAKSLYRNLIRYLDVNGDYPEEELKHAYLAVLAYNNLLLEGITLLGMFAHATRRPLEFLPFLRHFFVQARDYPKPNLYVSVVPLVLLAITDSDSSNDAVFDFLVETIGVCQEYYARNVQLPGMSYRFDSSGGFHFASYIVPQYRRASTVSTDWVKTRIQSALDNNNLLFFKSLLEEELPRAGIEVREPGAALGTLAEFFGTTDPDIVRMSQFFLARLRIYYPDDVDLFLDEQQASDLFQLQVRTQEPQETVGSLIGIRAGNFLRDAMISSESVRMQVQHIFLKAVDYRSAKEWVDYFLRELVNIIYAGKILHD